MWLVSVVASKLDVINIETRMRIDTTTAIVKRGLVCVASALLALVAVLVLARTLPAGLPQHLHDFQVEIAGVDYGVFDRVGGIARVALAGGEQSYYEVTLERHFVAHPSLSFWAERQRARHTHTSDIALVTHDRGGEQRYLLKRCQPLSWSVEAANTASGGYHETVVLAVQALGSS